MRRGIIHRLIDTLREAFGQLGLSVSPRTVESLAVAIHKVMTVQARYYHNMEHVFGLVDPANPIQAVAALFHDIIYYQVDLGLAPEFYPAISPYIRQAEGEIRLTEQLPPHDRLFAMTLQVFGFEPGQKLSPFAGLNEFLSALAMNNTLRGIVPERDLLKMTVCVEATIPFRGLNERGENHFDVLAARLDHVNTAYGLAMSAADIEQAVEWAVTFANRDVAGFAYPDPAMYLDETWKLLPETNIALRSAQIYSICDLRRALQKTEAFLGSLDPNLVFHRYKDTPPAQEFERLVAAAHRNIGTGREYLGVKLLAIAILEALAVATGGDAPLSLFMGDLQKEGRERPQRLEDFLPVIEVLDPRIRSAAVLKVLDQGRAGESDFDLKDSPLSSFIYKDLGPERAWRLLADAKDMFSGKLSALEFLERVDRPVISAIARASATMVSTRREALLQFAG